MTDKELEPPAEGVPENALPVDESQLVALAKSEGLLQESDPAPAEAEESAEADAEAAKELTPAEGDHIMAAIETVLFMSDKPVSLPRLRAIIRREAPLSVYRELMARLREEFAREHRGVEIAEVSMGFQLRTKPHLSPVLRNMVRTEPLKLTSAAMEVLSVIAYRQPATKDQLDRIRGVDCGYILRSLMEKRLIRISGRSDLPGRPMLYSTTHEFLELFSLKDLQSLPPLHEIEAMVAASEVGAQQEEEGRIEDFSKMVRSADKVLFDDSRIDEDIESIRAEIAGIATSTPYLEELEAKAAADQAQRHAEMIAQAEIAAANQAAAASQVSEKPEPERPGAEKSPPAPVVDA